jgi:magnesium chelatase subunit D
MKSIQSASGKGVRKEKSRARPAYPFTTLVGQEEMKLALVLNIVDPSIGGVVIMGHRGTGKSTAVRGLADLLPQISRVRHCKYQCDPADEPNLCDECLAKLASGEKLKGERSNVPVVDLPLGATEDRVCGTIDIEHALKGGEKIFEPGLLARANRGFLYIDEVNLLEDHLVDLLLDVAATGRNKVERESISIEHPARFVLIGSGNPEEGELRPQLLDRFGLYVEIKTENDLDRRVEIVERREAFERNPDLFCATVAKGQQELRRRITLAQKHTGAVKIDRALLKKLAQLCSELKVDGHRGELTIARAARALAAFESRKRVSEEDVRHVAVMALRHRLRTDPLEETASSERINQALNRLFPEQESKSGKGAGGNGKDKPSGTVGRESANKRSAAGGARANHSSANANGNSGGDLRTQLSSASDAQLPKFSLSDPSQTKRRESGSQSRQNQSQRGVRRTTTNYQRGRYASAVAFRKQGAKVAVDATLRAIAGARGQGSEVGQELLARTRDSRALFLTPDPRRLTPVQVPVHALRYKRLSRKSGRLFIFAIDTSGSMALNRIAGAKGVMVNLLKQSYVKRDSVALVGFRGKSAEILLPPSRSVLRVRRVLDKLPVGGGTPLSAGLARALEVVKRVGDTRGEIKLLLFTDGHANVPIRENANGIRARRRMIEAELSALGSELRKAGVGTVVVNSQNGFTANDEVRALARILCAEYQCISGAGRRTVTSILN